MSSIALDLMNRLRTSGMNENHARQIAAAFDRQVEKILSETRGYADQSRAESEEKAKTQFVSAGEYHARDKALATREDLRGQSAETNRRIDDTNRRIDDANNRLDETNRRIDALRDEFRKDIRVIHHILIGGFTAMIGGLIAIVAKLFLGG